METCLILLFLLVVFVVPVLLIVIVKCAFPILVLFCAVRSGQYVFDINQEDESSHIEIWHIEQVRNSSALQAKFYPETIKRTE